MKNFCVGFIAGTLVLTGSASGLHSQDGFSPTPAAAGHTGAHDFDFLVGEWRVHHHRLKPNSQDWVDFEGTCGNRKLMDGGANLEEYNTNGPSGAHRAVALRSYMGNELDHGISTRLVSRGSEDAQKVVLHSSKYDELKSMCPAQKNNLTTTERTTIMSTSTTNTIRLHRVLRAAPEKIYRAFLDADAMAKWLPPNGFTGKVHQMDAKVGGTYKMSFTNFTTGKSHSFGGTYVELKPHERIRYTDKFDDPNLPGEMQTTITLKKVSCGTELNIVQEGVPGVIPAEACYLGWQESLTLLAKLVEADIPD